MEYGLCPLGPHRYGSNASQHDPHRTTDFPLRIEGDASSYADAWLINYGAAGEANVFYSGTIRQRGNDDLRQNLVIGEASLVVVQEKLLERNDPFP